MFARTNTYPTIMVAPNGARKSKADHPKLPVSIEEICEDAVVCASAGADALHLHVRDNDGRHTLDTGRYREVIAELNRALPSFPIQITTEAAGLFDVAQQLQCLRHVRPKAASISVREIARAPELASDVYGLCRDEGVSVQHILYDIADWQRLEAWRRDKVVGDGQNDIICVLGTYAPLKPATLKDLFFIKPLLSTERGRCMVCAFGKAEHEVLCAAGALGADVRVGFENNIHGPDGQLARSNAANVAHLRSALTAAPREGILQ